MSKHICLHTKFRLDTFCSFRVMSRAKLCIALLLSEIYLPTKFLVDTSCSFRVMFQTRCGRTNGRTYGRMDRQTDGQSGDHMLFLREAWKKKENTHLFNVWFLVNNLMYWWQCVWYYLHHICIWKWQKWILKLVVSNTIAFQSYLHTYWRSQLHNYASIYNEGCGPSQVLNIAI